MPTRQIYSLPLHDALPISRPDPRRIGLRTHRLPQPFGQIFAERGSGDRARSEEHTSELQSRFDLVCRPARFTPFPYTTLFLSHDLTHVASASAPLGCHSRSVRYSLSVVPVTA